MKPNTRSTGVIIIRNRQHFSPAVFGPLRLLLRRLFFFGWAEEDNVAIVSSCGAVAFDRLFTLECMIAALPYSRVFPVVYL